MTDRAISKAVRRRPVFDRAKLAEVQANAILRKPPVGPEDGFGGYGPVPRNVGTWLSPRERREVASRLRKAEGLLRKFRRHPEVAEAADSILAALRQLGPAR